MRITKISVKGLFGMFDHEIPLNQESRITIVHGPNGVGKTVLMRMVHGLFNHDYKYLGEIPFEEFRIEFMDGTVLTVEKRVDDDDEAPSLLIDYYLLKGPLRSKGQSSPFTPSVKADWNIREQLVELHGGSVLPLKFGEDKYWVLSKEAPIASKEFEDSASPAPISSRQTEYVLHTQERILNDYPSLQNQVFGRIPKWFSSIRDFVSPKLILTARLTYEFNEGDLLSKFLNINYRVGKSHDRLPEHYKPHYKYIGTVASYSRPGSEVVGFPGPRDVVSDYASGSVWKTYARFDRDEQEIAELENALGAREVSNSEIAMKLLGKRLRNLKEHQEKTLMNPDYLKAKIFFDILNEQLLFKHLAIDEDDHVEILTGDGTSVPATKLSSGEQHLFILYYQLLFEVEPDTLVMIDEPELSMNVVWQRNFLKDLQRIIELRKFDVLVATHSPEVIYDKWDWTVALGAKADD